MKSRDGGATWAATGLSGPGITALTIDPAMPRTLYAATVRGYGNAQVFYGLFKSADGGTGWTALNNGLGHFLSTASSVTATDVLPVLSLDAPQPCVGAPWTVKLTRGGANAPARLQGTRDGEAWQADWRVTDASGGFSESGTFAAEGVPTLRVQAGGALSNSVSFAVSNCAP